jgi:hypothetical protein
MIEASTGSLHKLIEPGTLQYLVQPFIERMARRHRQLGVCDPDVSLLLPATPLAHRHARILRTIPVHHTIFSFRYPDLHHGLLGKLAIQLKDRQLLREAKAFLAVLKQDWAIEELETAARTRAFEF